MTRRIVPLFVLSLLPANAYAMSSFPGQIRNHLNLTNAPECILCHGSTAGGGPVVQPFGKSMLAAGLTMSGGGTLTSALDKLEQDGTDSDGDGVGDIDELKVGTSPNPDKTPIEYGCGGQISAHSPWGVSPAFAAALMSLIVLTRRLWGGSSRVTRTYLAKKRRLP
jgi:hypothetical protein